jgi:alpha-glucosidase (family GH31 glycosyl hydrolase)
MFGTDILAAPVVTPVDNTTNTTTKAIWLPPGNWIHFFNFSSYTGPQELSLTVGLSDLPLFVVAGTE